MAQTNYPIRHTNGNFQWSATCTCPSLPVLTEEEHNALGGEYECSACARSRSRAESMDGSEDWRQVDLEDDIYRL